MAISFNGSNEYLANSFAVLTAVPITMSCWFNTNDRSNSQAMITLVDASAADQYFMLRIQSGTEDVTVTTRGGAGAQSHNAPTQPTNGQWHHSAGVFAATDLRHAYIDGVTSGSSTGDRTPTGIDTTGVGTIQDSTPGHYFDGELAEAAIWNVALTAGEISSLAAGASPLYIRAGNLKAYWPMGGPMVSSAIATASAGNEIIGGFDGTVAGSPSFAAHPYQIFYPMSNMGALQSRAFVESAEEVVTPAEADIIGDDVLAEVISANLRRQGGICVNSGGKTFTKRDNDIVIAAQNQLTELDAKYVKQDRQDHRDEIPTDQGNSAGWFGE